MPNWKEYDSGEFVSWKEKGEVAQGVLAEVSETNFGDPKKGMKPVLHLQQADGSLKKLSCSQVRLLNQVIAIAPDIGDHVKVTYLGEDTAAKKPGQNAPKDFKVEVTPKAMLAGAVAPSGPGSSAPTDGDSPF